MTRETDQAARPMRQSDDLRLEHPGSLARPGPIGRFLRLLLGLFCFFVLAQVVVYHDDVIYRPATSLPGLVLTLSVALYIFNYVVNIGFTRNWGRRPAMIAIAVLVLAAWLSYALSGSPDHPLFGISLFVLLVYFYVHLGISFTLAAILATPGCEMRSIPELLGRISGREVAEHHCPAALISKVDAWESRRAG